MFRELGKSRQWNKLTSGTQLRPQPQLPRRTRRSCCLQPAARSGRGEKKEGFPQIVPAGLNVPRAGQRGPGPKTAPGFKATGGFLAADPGLTGTRALAVRAQDCHLPWEWSRCVSGAGKGVAFGSHTTETAQNALNLASKRRLGSAAGPSPCPPRGFLDGHTRAAGSRGAFASYG